MVNVRDHICFPTIIHEFNLDIPIHDKIQMVSYIKNSEIKPNGTRQTEDDINKISYFKHLKDTVINLNKGVLDKLGYEYEDIIITNMWGNLMSSGHTHSPHTHSNNFLSGVFYLQGDEISSPIEFFDPRPQTGILIPRREKNNIQNSNIVAFKPTENMGLIFPSWLQHWVRPTGSERISISWNIIIKGHYGEPHTLQNAYI